MGAELHLVPAATQRCTYCGEEKPSDHFSPHKHASRRCRACRTLVGRRAWEARFAGQRERLDQEATTGLRVCTSCGEAKDLQDYKARSRQCRACRNARNRDRYHADIQVSREYHRKKKRGYYSEHREFDPIRWMLDLCRNRARREGIPFNLTRQDLFLPDHCPVLGLKLRRPGEGQAEDSPSIDRIVPELGYVRGNVAVISMRANRLKNNATADEHARIAAWMRANGAT